jgi:hypothetical protein
MKKPVVSHGLRPIAGCSSIRQFTAVWFRVNGYLHHPGQNIDIAVRYHFLICIPFGTANRKNIGITAVEDTFLHDHSFSPTAGSELDLFADKRFHAFPASIEIRFYNHLHNTSGDKFSLFIDPTPIARIVSLS